MEGRTISFPKGEGSLGHNNREFIAKNVCPERTEWNKTYVKETIKDAYEKCFGEAVKEYNEKQKRKDRKINNYVKKIQNSDNGEKIFYENIVQIGTKDDTPVVDKDGNLTQAAKEAIDLLDEYAKTFQKRNPNLYLFNCVLHLDEATPHLHIDYIPVASGYKNGMTIRNSISKALQQMGFEKGKGRYDNEVIDWEVRERNYLMELCRERGIEVEIKGEKRDNLTLPEYKDAMRKVECLTKEAEKLDRENETLEKQASKMQVQVQELEIQNLELISQTQALVRQIEEVEKKEKEAQEVFKKHDLRAETLKLISKEVTVETTNMKSVAVPVTNFFRNEEYVKIKKSDWNKILDAFNQALSRNHLLEKYEKKISVLDKKTEKLIKHLEMGKQFITFMKLEESYLEFEKTLQTKTFQQKLEEKKIEALKQNQNRKKEKHEVMGEKKQLKENEILF